MNSQLCKLQFSTGNIIPTVRMTELILMAQVSLVVSQDYQISILISEGSDTTNSALPEVETRPQGMKTWT